MNPKVYTFSQHLSELRMRTLIVFVYFILSFTVSYYYSADIYNFLTTPLKSVLHDQQHRMIYTNLAEGFFTYMKLAAYTAFLLTIPILLLQIYLFVAAGLYNYEKHYLRILMLMFPILFYIGNAFMFYLIIPNAWHFFVSFESSMHANVLPIILEARISEYLGLVIQLSMAFGFAFEVPLILIILNLLNIISLSTLISQRRIAIVLNFIIAAILTPPDVLSQFALAIPLTLLYEASIIICKFVKPKMHVRHKMDQSKPRKIR